MKRSADLPFTPLFEARATTLLKRAGASESSIALWLSRVRMNGFMTVADFAELHGVDQAVVSLWLLKGWLRGSYKVSRVWHLPVDLVLTYRRRKKGPARRLSPEDVREIRTAFAANETLQSIADRYALSESMISRIVNGERYGDVA